MIMGAIARIGIVWDEITQGISDFSRTPEWTIPMASRMPSDVPMKKPSRVEESVIVEW